MQVLIIDHADVIAMQVCGALNLVEIYLLQFIRRIMSILVLTCFIVSLFPLLMKIF